MAQPGRELREQEAYGLLLLISLIWAGNFMAGKIALQVIGPLTLTALRAVIATGFLLWYVRFTYQTWPTVSAADLRTFFILSVTGLVTNTTVWYFGLRPLEVKMADLAETSAGRSELPGLEYGRASALWVGLLWVVVVLILVVVGVMVWKPGGGFP